MVDFQSRNTRRGVEEDEPEDEEAEDESETERTSDEGSETAGTTGIAIVTVGDADDAAADAVVETLETEIVTRERLRADHDGVQQRVDTLVERDDTIAVVSVGGVGIGDEDVTVEAVDPLFDKSLPGFGELFRLLAHDDLGSGIVSVRATGGIADGTPVLCLPGDEPSARLGAERIVAEELDDLVTQAG